MQAVIVNIINFGFSSFSTILCPVMAADNGGRYCLTCWLQEYSWDQDASVLGCRCLRCPWVFNTTAQNKGGAQSNF